jgi:hypothetical protein
MSLETLLPIGLVIAFLIYQYFRDEERRIREQVALEHEEEKARVQREAEEEAQALEGEKKFEEELRYRDSDEYKKKIYTDEYVIQRKEAFEKQLRTPDRTPDEVGMKEWYIYTYLIAPWYKILIAKHRYDLDRAFLIKKDFLTYIDLLRTFGSLAFMVGETYGEEDNEKWHSQSVGNYEMQQLIEKSFAELMGGECPQKIEKIQSASIMEFFKYEEERYR